MDIEASFLRRIVRDRATITVCGIGANRLRATLAALPSDTPSVILAGVAGGLRPTSVAPRIRAVISDSGSLAAPHWTIPWNPSASDTEALLVGVDAPAWTVEEKATLARASGADLVDCESHELASWAARAGAAWGVVRGVSDGPDDALPRAAEGWLDEIGKPNLGRVVMDLARRPSLIPPVLRMRSGTGRAMRAVAQGLDRLLDMISATPPANHAGIAPRIGPMPIDRAAQRVLVFGGTFDPPHRAHADLALHAMHALDCDAMTVVPAARSPHKATDPATSEADRVAMLELAFRGHAGVSICTAELDRARTHPNAPSYTADTVAMLREALGPAVELRLLMGADQAVAFHKWRDPQRIIEIAAPAVVLRPPVESAEALDAQLAAHWSADQRAAWRSWIVPAPLSQINATAVRSGAASPADSLPESVARFAAIRGLYGR